MPAAGIHTETARDIVIVGGGPVGLFLAGMLLKKKISVLVLEQKPAIDRHSKSLGIHPVSLELFDEAGIADCFIKQGVKIKQGMAFVNRREIGELSFLDCPQPFNFILALPQYKTEEFLNKWVDSLDQDAIVRGAAVTGIHQTGEKVTVSWQKNGASSEITCRYVVGCDGKNSFVRQNSGIKVKGSTYPDTYIMGDFSDNTDYGSRAAIYLHHDGLIESFPLPGAFRRWVVKTGGYIKKPDRVHLQKIVEKRIGHTLHSQQNVMMSSFGVQHQLAETFFSGRILLAGDAAHVVSPIGGQGMNLGWLNARRLSDNLAKALDKSGEAARFLSEYSVTSRKMAQTVAKRAEMNMWMGRRQRLPFMTHLITQLIVNTPLSNIAARRFTMRGL